MQLAAAHLDLDLDIGELEPLRLTGIDRLADLHSEVVIDGPAVAADDSLAEVHAPLTGLFDDLERPAIADRTTHTVTIGRSVSALACVASTQQGAWPLVALAMALRRRNLRPRRTACTARTTLRSSACSACRTCAPRVARAARCRSPRCHPRGRP